MAMTQDDLLAMSAEKAIDELSWESIEFLFKPQTTLELLLRQDFENTKKQVLEILLKEYFIPRPNNARFNDFVKAIKVEEFYRLMLNIKKANDRWGYVVEKHDGKKS